MQIRIGIVKESDDSWKNIYKLMDHNSKYNIVFFVSDGEECVKFLEQEDKVTDILLFVDNQFYKEQFEIIKTIKDFYFHVKIIFLTSSYNSKTFTKILDMGVDGFLLDYIYFSEFEYAIEQVFEGILYIDTRLLKQYHKYQSRTYVVDCKLTGREKEIITCVAAGMMNKEIAYYLKIREETVKNHLSNMFRKMNVKDRTQAVVYAIKNDLIEL